MWKMNLGLLLITLVLIPLARAAEEPEESAGDSGAAGGGPVASGSPVPAAESASHGSTAGDAVTDHSTAVTAAAQDSTHKVDTDSAMNKTDMGSMNKTDMESGNKTSETNKTESAGKKEEKPGAGMKDESMQKDQPASSQDESKKDQPKAQGQTKEETKKNGTKSENSASSACWSALAIAASLVTVFVI